MPKNIHRVYGDPEDKLIAHILQIFSVQNFTTFLLTRETEILNYY